MITSNNAKPLYIYLQRPDNAQWIVVGRYLLTSTGVGLFRYADSYRDAGHNWAIDPVNLPFMPGDIAQHQRYEGLHDVLRDACPDAWGQMIIRREHGLPAKSSALRYLELAGNGDRWGALAVGRSKAPNIAQLSSPRLPQLDAFVKELLAIAANRPPINATIRKRLFATPSLGGARPKATLQDGQAYWLIKPTLPTDTVDIGLLEHVTQQWGQAAGLRFADTVHHALSDQGSIVRVRRFDRQGQHRMMAVSAASLLQVEYPHASPDQSGEASYGRLAEELKRIGAPPEDQQELFERMIFNAVVGNDDDHPRNHAVIYVEAENRWRLAPAFDVVPNPDETPKRLLMQPAAGRWDISRETLLADYLRFGLMTEQNAQDRLDALLTRIEQAFAKVNDQLNVSLRNLMAKRLQQNCALLSKQ